MMYPTLQTYALASVLTLAPVGGLVLRQNLDALGPSPTVDQEMERDDQDDSQLHLKTEPAESTMVVTTPRPSAGPRPGTHTVHPATAYKAAPKITMPLKKRADAARPRRSESARTNPTATSTDAGVSRRRDNRSAVVFRRLVAEGTSLLEDGTSAPAYAVSIGAELIDALVTHGLACLGVFETSENRLFLFDGTLRRPSGPRLATATDRSSYSSRVIFLNSPTASSLISPVHQRFFAGESVHLSAVMLVRFDLDAAVLAAQQHAATQLGIELSHVSMTSGQFLTSPGVPFSYVIEELLTQDGQRVLAPTDTPSSSSDQNDD